MRFSALLLLPILLLCGCISRYSQIDPSANFSTVKTVFVEQRLGDDHHVDQVIVAELSSLGLEVTSGAYTMRPERVDAIVSYTDRWEWDFRSYLIEVAITVRDGRNDKIMASASYYRPSVASKTPAEMLHEMLPPLFKSRKYRPKLSPELDPVENLHKDKAHKLN